MKLGFSKPSSRASSLSPIRDPETNSTPSPAVVPTLTPWSYAWICGFEVEVRVRVATFPSGCFFFSFLPSNAAPCTDALGSGPTWLVMQVFRINCIASE